MNLARTSLDDVDIRYRALVDVAGALTSHSHVCELLASLRGHLEPIVQFTFLVVCLWDRESDRLTVTFFEPCDSPAARVVGELCGGDIFPGQAVHAAVGVLVAGRAGCPLRVESGGVRLQLRALRWSRRAAPSARRLRAVDATPTHQRTSI